MRRGLAWGLRVHPADVQVVLLAVDAPADAHLAQVEVTIFLLARPKFGAHMLPELRLPALAPALKLVAAVAEPPCLVLFLRAAIFCRRLILDQFVRVDRAHQDLIGEENGPPDLVICRFVLVNVC